MVVAAANRATTTNAKTIRRFMGNLVDSMSQRAWAGELAQAAARRCELPHISPLCVSDLDRSGGCPVGARFPAASRSLSAALCAWGEARSQLGGCNGVNSSALSSDLVLTA